MLLLPEDIERIENLGYEESYFVVYVDGFAKLRNVDGHCIFFDPTTKRCKIYSHRPLGCRIYPIIFDEEYGVMLDPLCPYRHMATCRDVIEGIEMLRNFLRRVEEAYDYRIDWGLFYITSRSLVNDICRDHIYPTI